ncbi:MAG: discoidin domain-containing protein [bacterium]
MKKHVLACVLAFGMIVFCLQTVYALNTDKLVYLKVKDALASSFDDTKGWAPDPNPMAPFDGDVGTRWSPKLGLDGEWIYFDLGSEKTVSVVCIVWERAFATEYEILISDDAKKWTSLKVMKDQDGGNDTIEFDPVKTRYIKFIGTKRANPLWGFSIWECLAFGPKSANPNDKKLKEVYTGFPVTQKELLVEGFSKEVKKVEPIPGNGPIEKDEFHTGMTFTSWHETEIASKKSHDSLEHLYKNDNVKFVAIMVNWYQQSIDSTKIERDKLAGSTVSDEALGHAINKAHELGMKVMLKPHVDIHDGDPRHYIIPSVDWFISYTNFIVHYAKLAEEYNVELFCIGTELRETTTDEWEEIWRAIIFEIQKEYKGQLTYAANWDEYIDVPFWDAMDFIGIDAYFPLSEDNNATLEQLDEGWKYYASEIENFLKQMNYEDIPVIFTELGYANVDGCNVEPWAVASEIEDEDEQADCLDSALAVLTEKKWFKGMYWWDYLPTQRTEKYGFHLGKKAAEEVLSEWYKDLNE